jgi:Uma2 family endonuclease
LGVNSRNALCYNSIADSNSPNGFAAMIKEKLSHEKNCADACCILMETDWNVSNDTLVRPDVMLICQEIDEKVLVTPELVIEVVFSTSTKRDEVMKFDLYQREGLPYHVLVYPENRLAKIYRNDSQGFKKRDDYSSNG